MKKWAKYLKKISKLKKKKTDECKSPENNR